jgi:hypothetical protein
MHAFELLPQRGEPVGDGAYDHVDSDERANQHPQNEVDCSWRPFGAGYGHIHPLCVHSHVHQVGHVVARRRDEERKHRGAKRVKVAGGWVAPCDGCIGDPLSLAAPTALERAPGEGYAESVDFYCETTAGGKGRGENGG